MTIRLLQPVAEWPAGAVVDVTDRQGRTLVATGYAVVVDAPASNPVESAAVRHQPRDRGRAGKGTETR